MPPRGRYTCIIVREASRHSAVTSRSYGIVYGGYDSIFTYRIPGSSKVKASATLQNCFSDERVRMRGNLNTPVMT